MTQFYGTLPGAARRDGPFRDRVQLFQSASPVGRDGRRIMFQPLSPTRTGFAAAAGHQTSSSSKNPQQKGLQKCFHPAPRATVPTLLHSRAASQDERLVAGRDGKRVFATSGAAATLVRSPLTSFAPPPNASVSLGSQARVPATTLAASGGGSASALSSGQLRGTVPLLGSFSTRPSGVNVASHLFAPSSANSTASGCGSAAGRGGTSMTGPTQQSTASNMIVPGDPLPRSALAPIAAATTVASPLLATPELSREGARGSGSANKCHLSPGGTVLSSGPVSSGDKSASKPPRPSPFKGQGGLKTSSSSGGGGAPEASGCGSRKPPHPHQERQGQHFASLSAQHSPSLSSSLPGKRRCAHMRATPPSASFGAGGGGQRSTTSAGHSGEAYGLFGSGAGSASSSLPGSRPTSQDRASLGGSLLGPPPQPPLAGAPFHLNDSTGRGRWPRLQSGSQNSSLERRTYPSLSRSVELQSLRLFASSKNAPGGTRATTDNNRSAARPALHADIKASPPRAENEAARGDGRNLQRERSSSGNKQSAAGAADNTVTAGVVSPPLEEPLQKQMQSSSEINMKIETSESNNDRNTSSATATPTAVPARTVSVNAAPPDSNDAVCASAPVATGKSKSASSSSPSTAAVLAMTPGAGAATGAFTVAVSRTRNGPPPMTAASSSRLKTSSAVRSPHAIATKCKSSPRFVPRPAAKEAARTVFARERSASETRGSHSVDFSAEQTENLKEKPPKLLASPSPAEVPSAQHTPRGRPGVRIRGNGVYVSPARGEKIEDNKFGMEQEVDETTTTYSACAATSPQKRRFVAVAAAAEVATAAHGGHASSARIGGTSAKEGQIRLLSRPREVCASPRDGKEGVSTCATAVGPRQGDFDLEQAASSRRPPPAPRLADEDLLNTSVAERVQHWEARRAEVSPTRPSSRAADLHLDPEESSSHWGSSVVPSEKSSYVVPAGGGPWSEEDRVNRREPNRNTMTDASLLSLRSDLEGAGSGGCSSSRADIDGRGLDSSCLSAGGTTRIRRQEERGSRRRRVPNLAAACSHLNSILSPDADAAGGMEGEGMGGELAEAQQQERVDLLRGLPTPARRLSRTEKGSSDLHKGQSHHKGQSRTSGLEDGDETSANETDHANMDDITADELHRRVVELFEIEDSLNRDDTISSRGDHLRHVWELVVEKFARADNCAHARKKDAATMTGRTARAASTTSDLAAQVAPDDHQGEVKIMANGAASFAAGQNNAASSALLNTNAKNEGTGSGGRGEGPCVQCCNTAGEGDEGDEDPRSARTADHLDAAGPGLDEKQQDAIEIAPGTPSLPPNETLLWKLQVAEAYFRSPHVVQYTVPHKPLEPGQCIQFKYKHRTSYITDVPADAKPGEVRLHTMTKNGPLPLSRSDAELKMLERPEVNRRDLMDQLRSGCRLCRREGQSLEELVSSNEWQERNSELAEMYSALSGQAMDCLLSTVHEDELLADESENALDALLTTEVETSASAEEVETSRNKGPRRSSESDSADDEAAAAGTEKKTSPRERYRGGEREGC